MNSLVNILPHSDLSHGAKSIKELVVISGKGGTGKTSLVASFAALSRNLVLADCDVDAADLHLLADPRVIQTETFTGGKRASIDVRQCVACGLCKELCRFDAIHVEGPGGKALAATYHVDAMACEGCTVCAWFCPAQAIECKPVVDGEWFISDTRFGPMVHARLHAAQENSGKLVSLVRTTAKRIAEERQIELVIIDGSPGIGCPVIASVTGADLALIVTEPTPSGFHDMERVADLARHFGIPAAVCINKWDLNPEMTSRIEAKAQERGMTLVGRVRYDRTVTAAQIEGKTIVEYGANGSSSDVRQVWERLIPLLAEMRIPL